MTADMLIIVLLALIAGLGAGYFVWGRAVVALRRDVARQAEDMTLMRLAKSESDQRAAAAEALRTENERLRCVELEHERFKSAAEERDANHVRREAELEQKFAKLAADVLEKSQKTFVERAEETLKNHREVASAGLKENQAALDKLIAPMRDTLGKYEKKLGEIETARATAYGAITNAIAEVKSGQERVSGEAAKLVNALRNAPKARGRWGEHQLRRVLEMAGLSRHVDFSEEVAVENEAGRQRPDAIIHMPGDRVLVIDAKCSLNSYQDAVDAPDEETRTAHMLAHAKALRAHVDTLGRKSYTQQFDDTLDFVIMFIPGENFLAAALEVDQDLFETAFARKVLLASPTNLIAIARTIAMVWQQEKAAEDARQIAALGKELHDRLATMGEHVVRLGKSLEGASGAYNKMVGSLESQVLTSARKLNDLAIEAPNKTIGDTPRVTADIRPLTKLAPPDAEAAE